MPDSPHPRDFEQEELARQLHASLAVTWGTSASHELGHLRIEKVGFANIPFLIVPVTCKRRDLRSMIPVCRQLAFGYLAERGVSDEHLKFTPSVSSGSRRTRFCDQHGQARMGERHEVRFELSQTLVAAVAWERSFGRRGELKALWEC